MGNSTNDEAGLAARVRLFVFQHFVNAGSAPSRAQVAEQMGLSQEEVDGAFERLAEGKALVLQPASGEVLMAEPFSAVPTAFEVEVGDRSWWGNCIWDALGIPAALGRDGRVRTSCGDSGQAMELEVRDGELLPAEGVVHYAVPARRWWEDVVFA
ncbi:MAG: organomercurial lyase [Acidobacteriota bacterium]